MVKSERISESSHFEERTGSCSVKATVHLADLASQDASTAAASPWGNAMPLVVPEGKTWENGQTGKNDKI